MKKNPFSKKKVLIITIISIFIIFLIGIIFMLCIKFDKNVYSNISLNGRDISGYTPEQLVLYINELSSQCKQLSIDITQGGEKIYTLTSQMIDAQIDISATAKQVMDIGRNGSFFANIKKVLSLTKNREDVKAIATYNQEKMQTILKNVELTLNNRVEYDTYSIDEENNKLILIKGRDGYTIDFSNLEQQLKNHISNISGDKLQLTTISKSSGNLSAKQIISEVKREVKDAYIDDTTNPITFVEEIVGIDVNEEELSKAIDSLNELKNGESLEVQLSITKPTISLEDIRYDIYDSKLSSYTTYFAGNQKNRSNNIKVASEYINDVIVMPGEIFSFNNTVGNITKEKGYLNAATFQGGKVVDGIGGGICQVSSTLYNTVLLANLEIVERYAHSMPVSYVLPGRDATIYVGALDFKFKNTRNYPIKIITSYSPTGSLNISIYGTKEEKEYTIEIQSNTIEEIKFSTEYIKDNSLPKGKEEVITAGTNGIVSEAYIIKKLYGKEVERKLLSKDTYSSVNKVVKVGNK